MLFRYARASTNIEAESLKGLKYPANVHSKCPSKSLSEMPSVLVSQLFLTQVLLAH
jgi:hypothetical protein